MINGIQNIYTIGRRKFLQAASVLLSMTIVGYRATGKAYAATVDYISARINAVYAHDKVMKYRKSQDNPFVKKLYGDYLPYPMCEKSETLLHAKYVDRSPGLSKIDNPHGKLKND